MSYILTYTGQHVNLAHPDPRTIRILDIAHALSHVNRFTGHTELPYSVAQHSVLAACHAPKHLQLEALLHDAAEAYLGDVSSPLKAMLPDYQRIEHNLDLVIRQVFGLSLTQTPDVKLIDKIMLATERRDILRDDGPVWPMLEGVPVLPTKIEVWTAKQAKTEFIEVFEFLTK